MISEIIVNTNAQGVATFTTADKIFFKRMIAQYKNATVLIKVKKYCDGRTLKQNKYYWLLLSVIANRANELGNKWSESDAHAFLKDEFLKKEHIVFNSKKIMGFVCKTIVKSSTTLTKAEFAEYIANIKMWALDFLDLDLEII